MASELVTEYLKDDIIEFLFTHIYRGNTESAMLFPSADQYITIIYQEGKYILDNIYNSKETFRKRFLYPDLTLEQRDFITFSLMYFVDMHLSGQPKFIQLIETTKRKHGFSEDQIKEIIDPLKRKEEKLKMVENLLQNERQAIHYYEKTIFRDGIENKIKNIASNTDKISYLRNTIFNVKAHPFYRSYPVHYNNIISFCNVEIEKLTILKPAVFENGTNNNSPLELSDTPLKRLFNDVNKYNAVVVLLIEKHLIIRTTDGLQWRGYKSNAKYEAVAFLEVVTANGWLNKKIIGHDCIIKILSGTFSGFTCSDKTARNKKINATARPLYDTLLSSI